MLLNVFVTTVRGALLEDLGNVVIDVTLIHHFCFHFRFSNPSSFAVIPGSNLANQIVNTN